MIPPPPDGFEWRDFEPGPALVCTPLDAFAAHVFSTSAWPLGLRGAPLDGDGWNAVAHALQVPRADLVRARQIHGVAVSIGRPGAGVVPDADVLIGREDRLALAIQVADCVPILIGDPETGAIAAVHAGWRGLAAHAPAVALEALGSEFGSRPQKLLAALGPSIGACCYQVGREVRERFEAEGHGRRNVDLWFRRAPVIDPRNPPMPGLDARPRSNRWFFDGWSSAIDQLVDAGMSRANVFNAALCTASHPDVFCSYRRDGPPAGRLSAAIRIRSHRPSPGLPGDPRARSPRA